MNPTPSDSSDDKLNQEALIRQFRAHLHLAITARQTGQSKQFKELPGPHTETYCRALANLPDNTLAGELAAPIMAILNEISRASAPFQATLLRNDEESRAHHESAKNVLAQVDLALGFAMRVFYSEARHRGEFTEVSDFLCEMLYDHTHSGGRIAKMARRYLKVNPEEAEDEEGGFVSDYAWDVYQRVAELDRLADEFPHQVSRAARSMHAWPMLVHRHTNNRRRFQVLADRLRVGADHPIDASEGARFRPDTPLVQYLEALIYRIHEVRWEVGDRQFDSLKAEQDWLCGTWWSLADGRPSEVEMAALRAAWQLPVLTKATAAQWAEKAVVPLIMATDAHDYQKCTKPALQAIARQKGVKSKATFKSRLLSAVTATLRRLARPA
jgi:hypothetical protein